MVDFIREYQIDTAISRDLIQYFEDHPRKVPGVCGNDELKPSVKSSTDIQLTHNEMLEDKPVNAYFRSLNECLKEYVKEFPECSINVDSWDVSNANIQKYKPKEGYYKWHCERTGPINMARHLVFSTFLNNVTKGGHTEFKYQKKAIEAVEGKTIIFPADWTYTHRGRVSKTQEKYIITGWLSFIDR